MKTKIAFALSLFVLTTLCCIRARGQGTAFTYQGRLNDGGAPANGTYDLVFTIYDLPSGPGAFANQTNAAVAISNGLFAVALDFGPGIFTGPERWLEIGVRTNGGGAFTILAPRQELTPTPYAITAGNVTGVIPSGGLSGIYSNAVNFNNSANQFTGTFAGDGAAVSNVNAMTLEGLAASDFWQVNGNAGTTAGIHFLGTMDNQPLDLRVNNQRGLRLMPTRSNDTINVLGGSPLNYVDPNVMSATIAGGGTPDFFGPRSNSLRSDFATIGGGADNHVGTNSNSGVIAGGFHNRISDNASDGTISGGFGHLIQSNAYSSTISGGYQNRALAPDATVSGGYTNIASGFRSTVSGGAFNVATNQYGVVGGGQANQAQGAHNTISGGAVNIADGLSATVGGGSVNRAIATDATVSGGHSNLASGLRSTIGGGAFNEATDQYATVPGGFQNQAPAAYGFAAGHRAKANHPGAFVWADSTAADFASTAANSFNVRASGGAVFETVGNGISLDGQPVLAGQVTALQIADGATLAELADDDGSGSGLDADLLDGLDSSAFWKLGGNAGTSPGPDFLGTTDNQALEVKVNGVRALRLEPNTDTPNVIAGFSGNYVRPGLFGATICGGAAVANLPNIVTNDGHYAAISGGYQNVVGGYTALIAGGRNNHIEVFADHSAIGGGGDNRITGSQALPVYAAIGGGRYNLVETNASYSTIGGGYNNVVQSNALGGTVAGGYHNVAGGLNGPSFSVASAVGGGDSNSAEAPYATIAGGVLNTNRGFGATLAGGRDNTIEATASYATIPGGRLNTAAGIASFAAGYRAKANHDGCFVWADLTEADFASNAADQFLVRADFVGINRATRITSNEYFGLRAPVTNDFGGMYVETAGTGKPFYGYSQAGVVNAYHYVDGLDTNKWKLVVGGGDRIIVTTGGSVGIGVINPTNRLHVAGGVSATAFVNTSDRNAKENFSAVSPAEVLDKVVSLPITRWTFKEMKDGEHLGPTAQDFYAAFGLGGGETTITTLDADGVALAAIQGLNQKTENRSQKSEVRIEKLEQRLEQKETEITELKSKLEKLERLLLAQDPKGN